MAIHVTVVVPDDVLPSRRDTFAVNPVVVIPVGPAMSTPDAALVTTTGGTL